MRILHTADWHLGKNLEGRSRREEQEAFLAFLAEETERLDPDLILMAGDVYDSGNPPAWAEQLFYDTLKKLSHGGRRMTVVIAGNHDSPERLTASAPLAREHGILLCGLPKTRIEPGEYGENRVTDSGEGWLEAENGEERAVILTVPYPSEKRLNEFLYEGKEEEAEKAASYGERMKALFDGLAVHFKEDAVNLAVAHLFAMGSTPGGSERVGQLGGSYLIDGSILPRGAQYIALGHVHKPQIVPGTGHRGRYAGAPMAYHRDEAAAADRSFLYLDLTPGQEAEPVVVGIPCVKPLVRVHCGSVDGAEEWCREHAGETSWVFLDVETDRYIREEEMRRMRELKEDIIEIHPIIKADRTPEEWERAQAAKGFTEQFREFYLAQKGVPPQEELVELLLDVLGEGEEDETADTDDSGN